MKIPSGMVDLKGNAFKGFVFLSSSSNNEGELQEFGIERDGNTVSCFVLTAPGDVIELGYALSAGTCDFFDVVVDGVRRYSMANDKDVFRGTAKRVLYSARGKGQRRGGVKNSLMQVKARDFDNEADEEDEPISSVVGTIIFEAFQKPRLDGDDEANTPGDCDRYPDFEKCATWEETTDHHGIRDGEPTTSMEIDLIDGTKTPKAYKDKVLRSYSAEYKQVAKFIFKLRSTSDLEAMGQFEDVPEYEAPEYVTLEQKRALRAAAASSDTQAAAGDDDEEQDEGSAKSKAKSTAGSAGSAKKAASKTPKGKGGKIKSNTKSTKVEEDAEEEDGEEENDEPAPTVPKKAARTTSKAKASKQNGKATSPAKSISEVSTAVTDISVDNNDENEDATVKDEEDVSVQPSIHRGSGQNIAPSTDDVTQYMEAQDDENDEDIVKSSSDGAIEKSRSTPELPFAEYTHEYPNLNSEDFEVAQILVGMSAPALPDKQNTIEHPDLDFEDAKASLILVDAPVQDTTLGSTAREELVEVAEGIEIVQEPKGQGTTSTPLKKKSLTLQGSPEAPAYHAWLDRDKELERQRQLLIAEVEATVPAEELRESAVLPFESVTSPPLNPTDLQIRKSKSKMDTYGELAGAEGADDSDFDSDDLDAPLRTPSKPMRMMADKQNPDLSVLDNKPEGQGSDAIEFGKEITTLINPAAEADADADVSQLTDVAPIDDVLASVANSKRVQTIVTGISIDLGAAYEEEQALRKAAGVMALQNTEDNTASELDLAGRLEVQNSTDIITTGNRVSARSASPGVPTKPKSTLQGPVKLRASSTPAKGEPISQSQISTQSHDSKYNLTSSPLVGNAKAATLGESPASGQKGTKEDIDGILLPKNQSAGASDTKSAPVGLKTTTKRKVDSMVDASPESPDPKKPSPDAKTGKPAGKRVSISSTPAEVVAAPRKKTVTPSKKASEKRKFVEPNAETTTTATRKSPAKATAKANVNEKRKAASISDTKADTDTPRKSASTPAHRKTSAVEKEMSAAKARVEAAENMKRELQEEYQAALLVKEERDKAKHMNEKAEEIERENAELQAKIAAIYNISTD